jgi:hypothetical protein
LLHELEGFNVFSERAEMATAAPPSLPPPGPHEPNTFEEKQSRQRGYKFEHSLLFMNAGFLATDKRRHRRNPFKTKFG